MTALAVLAGAIALAVAEIPTVYLWSAWALMALALGVIVLWARTQRSPDADAEPGERAWWQFGNDDTPDWSESELHRLSPLHAWEYGDANGKRVLR